MKKDLTELVFILDRSGSMQGLTGDTIGGFNSLIEKQRGEKGGCFVSAVLFNNVSSVLYDRVPLDKIPEMTRKDYQAMGNTALVDAIGAAIHHIGNVHKYARAEDVPEHTLFVIITDGMENASHIYTSDKVKSMIERQKSKYGWEFLFIGANIDAVETARNFGIAKECAVDYIADPMGTDAVYGAVCSAVSMVRTSAQLSADWSEQVSSDYKKRSMKRRK